MAHTNPTDEELRAILTEATTIAMVGASSNPERPSHGVMKRLLARGFDVIPVNPREREVLGRTAYRSLLEVPVAVDIVDVFRPAETTPPIADDAIRIGAKVLWLQLGIINEEAAARAAAAGLTVVMDACLGVVVVTLDIRRN